MINLLVFVLFCLFVCLFVCLFCLFVFLFENIKNMLSREIRFFSSQTIRSRLNIAARTIASGELVRLVAHLSFIHLMIYR